MEFRQMIVSLGLKLSTNDAKSLAFVYLEKENLGDVESGIYAVDTIIKRGGIVNYKENLRELKKSLDSLGRNDLMRDVEEYLANNPSLPEYANELGVPATVGACLQEKESDTSNSTVTGAVFGKRTDPGDHVNNGGTTQKRRRIDTEEERELEEATGNIFVCDSTSDSSSDSADDDTDRSTEEPTHEDKNFMAEARKCAMRSKDEQTKVGAVLVNRTTKEIIGRGWNRWPQGCDEGRFTWGSGEGKPLQDGKHLYVVYAIRASIFDAYKNNADPAHSILYTTLYPSNVCAQCIREAGIDEVVYISDKFHRTKFMKASRKIMKGIKTRLFNETANATSLVTSCTQ